MKTAFLSQGLQAKLKNPCGPMARNTFRMLIIYEEQLLSSIEANRRRAAQLSFSPFHLYILVICSESLERQILAFWCIYPLVI